jgi:hypothetical protein
MAAEKNMVLAGVLAILWGAWGIDQFYMGDKKGGLKSLLITVLLWWLLFIPYLVMVVKGIIRGVKYLKNK